MKRFLALAFAAMVAVVVACHQGSAPTEPAPVPEPTPVPTAVPAGCTWTDIRVINGVCYACTHGTVGSVACPANPTPVPPPPTATPVAPCAPGTITGVGTADGPKCVDCHGNPVECPVDPVCHTPPYAVSGSPTTCWDCHGVEVPCNLPEPTPTPDPCPPIIPSCLGR